MSFTCKNGSEHQHETVAQSKICWGVIKPPAPDFRATPAPAVEHGITRRQLDYIKSLGGNQEAAECMTKSTASNYIKNLLREKRRGAFVPTPSTYPAFDPKPETPAAPAWTPPPARVVDPRLVMVKSLIQMLPDGYFAAQEEEGAPVTFLRISHPKRNKLAGALKIQTQHGPRLETEAILWPSGNWSIYKPAVIDALMSLIVDYRTAAMRYSRLIGKCCRCNSPLTDDKSRHYGIGPICDQVWTWVIEMVDDQNDGKSFEQLVREPGYVAVSRRV